MNTCLRCQALKSIKCNTSEYFLTAALTARNACYIPLTCPFGQDLKFCKTLTVKQKLNDCVTHLYSMAIFDELVICNYLIIKLRDQEFMSLLY